MSGDAGDEGAEKSPLVEFLTKRGTLEMICAIGDSGASPTEITEQVNISHETVSHRLRDGEVIYDVWYSELAPRDSDYRKQYHLDVVGLNVKERVDESGMLEAFHQLLPYRQALWDAEEDVEEWIEHNEEEVTSDFTVGGVSQSTGDAYDTDYEDTVEDSTSRTSPPDESADGDTE